MVFHRYYYTFVGYNCNPLQSMKSLNLTLLMLLTTVLSIGQVSTSEKNALIALSKATKGELWKHPWDLTTPVETWHGVEVVDQKVVALRLDFNNLNGPLPSQLSDLIYLQHLSLFRNSISGKIPNSFGNMASLKSLNLSFNRLKGTIPTSLTKLKTLESLQLFMNDLSGEIPKEIGNMTSLRTLELYSNNLTGSIPQSVEKLVNLQSLGLSSNALTGKLPTDFSQLKKLKSLSVFDNQLLGVIPESIGDLASLEELVLSNNAFYGDLPHQLVKLTKLKTLLIGNNSFKGEFAQLGKKFPNLVEFDYENASRGGVLATLDTED